MSGFNPKWLALREPVDHASVNHRVRQQLLTWIATRPAMRIVDLGCGTGSNFRALAPEVGRPQSWQLVDHDATLLDVAHRLTAETAANCQAEITFKQADLSNGRLSGLIDKADLVTAAAFFDLVSQTVIERMVCEITAARCAFYTTLTYDGIAAWLPGHALHDSMRDAFNAHQRGDKGFGPAAGPDATDLLEAAFEAHGFDVYRGPSPWILGPEQAELRRETDSGWAGAVRETGAVAPSAIDAWLATRERSESIITIVGHEDLFAFPPS